MKLSALLIPWVSALALDCEILGLQNDSRLIKPGDLFLAYPGAASDGRQYVAEAIKAGAVAIVYEPNESTISCSVPCVAFPHLSKKIAVIASRFYDYPSRLLNVTGVTGTNGKTTIAYQLAQAYDLLGSKAAYIGTLGHGCVDALHEASNTTPDALQLQRLCHDYSKDSIQRVCMEVSSHALVQGRVDEIDFTQAIYTNLSHEHLDYHQTMEAYAEAKSKLFASSTLTSAILNYDDAHVQTMIKTIPDTCQILSYGCSEECDVRAYNIDVSMDGCAFEVASPWGIHSLHVKSVGLFNIYNSLAVFTSLLANGYPVDDVVQVMAKLHAASGRMEVVAQTPCVIVDYAHTPDALENALTTLDALKKGRLWVVFGCGGDRDKRKRPLMGRIASQYADVVVITSDNPRTEDPSTIIEEIRQGVCPSADVITIIDRQEAICQTLKQAHPSDIILIAGKGHESYQQIGKERLAFSDQAVVKQMSSML